MKKQAFLFEERSYTSRAALYKAASGVRDSSDACFEAGTFELCRLLREAKRASTLQHAHWILSSEACLG